MCNKPKPNRLRETQPTLLSHIKSESRTGYGSYKCKPYNYRYASLNSSYFIFIRGHRK